MPSDRTLNLGPAARPSRRRFLATVGAVASASTAGCTGVFPGSGSGDANEPNEVIVENATAGEAEIAVRVADEDGRTLFSRVFALGPERIASHEGIDVVPARIHAFTADGVSRAWRYDPDLPIEFECEPKDVGLTLGADGIEPWYDC
ncbi:hypothetical protein SAMN04488066_10913 [Halorubrum aquaticum]|uniref:Uncharacterized protein n=1 Tax=Halorubrum aquaticum TaxID=387340 RepID=A0A1I3B2E4_9EURY|nr:hypothetical protein [Halorubrum aquaticum]SFH56495.1 hypothetical protein SAMN04488066_10913 [Halorubrum aquaticum]